MKPAKSLSVTVMLYLLLFFALRASFAQGTVETIFTTFEKVKSSVILIDDGQSQAYGIYLARARNGKFMFVLSSNQLSLGIEKRIRGVLLDGKVKQFKAEKLSADIEFNVALYRLESPPKNLTTITRIPQDSLRIKSAVWALGSPVKPSELQDFRVTGAGEELIELDGKFSDKSFYGPIFDSQGRIAGYIVNSNASVTQLESGSRQDWQVVSIASLLKYAADALKELDLYPVWKEVYPSQYAINQVMESVVLLDTKKSGTGMFLGWSRSKTDTTRIGYALTAFHVVEDETQRYSVQFTEDFEGQILGETMIGSIDRDLDLAIVRILNSPAIKPVKFIRNSDLQELESNLTAQYIASLGYGAFVDWKLELGSLTKVTNQFIETNLSLEAGDSGGPVFNDKGEVLGLNRATARTGNVLSLSINSAAISKYLKRNLGKVDFEERWGFFEYPSFWRRNRMWLVSAGATAAGSLAVALLVKRDKTLPAEPFSGHPDFP